MADFSIAYKRTEKNEGKNVWTNITGDTGGETWSGITRKSHPKSEIWKIIDEYKKTHMVKNGTVITSPKLEILKQELYKNEYWMPVWGDRIRNQSVANDMYDTAVNMGVTKSISLSQRQFGIAETGKMNEELLNMLNSVK